MVSAVWPVSSLLFYWRRPRVQPFVKEGKRAPVPYGVSATVCGYALGGSDKSLTLTALTRLFVSGLPHISVLCFNPPPIFLKTHRIYINLKTGPGANWGGSGPHLPPSPVTTLMVSCAGDRTAVSDDGARGAGQQVHRQPRLTLQESHPLHSRHSHCRVHADEGGRFAPQRAKFVRVDVVSGGARFRPKLSDERDQQQRSPETDCARQGLLVRRWMCADYDWRRRWLGIAHPDTTNTDAGLSTSDAQQTLPGQIADQIQGWPKWVSHRTASPYGTTQVSVVCIKSANRDYIFCQIKLSVDIKYSMRDLNLWHQLLFAIREAAILGLVVELLTIFLH